MSIFKVQKRNGSIVSFDRTRIERAITRASDASTPIDQQEVSRLCDAVIRKIETGKETIPDIETIQDTIERILMDSGHDAVAKTFILYRERRTELRSDRSVTVEVERTMDEYLGKTDWRVHANANSGYSLGGLILNTSGKVTANYWLSHIYSKEAGDAHRNADIHIHDLDMFSGYCAGWSLRALLEE